jgi:glyoxylase I family protein
VCIERPALPVFLLYCNVKACTGNFATFAPIVFERNHYMMLNRIHHIAIICSDYERSKNFYVNILGLEVLQEVYRAERKSYKLDLSVGGVYQIELFSFDNPPERSSRPESAGLRHLAFEVEDVAIIAAELATKGVITESIRIDEYTGKQFTFFADPDGLPLELYQA